jgi:hypothetical protein
MIDSERAEFAKVVLGFAELKGKQLSLAAVDLYWHAMADWELAEFKSAAVHLLKSCEFMPTPKDFEDLRKAGRPTAGEAFAIALQHAASSAYRAGLLGDPLIDAAVRAIGGYVVIAMCEEDKLHYLARRFAEHYEKIQDSCEVRVALPEIAKPRLNGPMRMGALLGRGSDSQ